MASKQKASKEPRENVREASPRAVAAPNCRGTPRVQTAKGDLALLTELPVAQEDAEAGLRLGSKVFTAYLSSNALFSRPASLVGAYLIESGRKLLATEMLLHMDAGWLTSPHTDDLVPRFPGKLKRLSNEMA